MKRKGIITLIIEAAHTSEMLVNFYETTWCNIPESFHLQKVPFNHIFCTLSQNQILPLPKRTVQCRKMLKA
jgi:hypothetical protein